MGDINQGNPVCKTQKSHSEYASLTNGACATSCWMQPPQLKFITNIERVCCVRVSIALDEWNHARSCYRQVKMRMQRDQGRNANTKNLEHPPRSTINPVKDLFERVRGCVCVGGCLCACPTPHLGRFCQTQIHVRSLAHLRWLCFVS